MELAPPTTAAASSAARPSRSPRQHLPTRSGPGHYRGAAGAIALPWAALALVGRRPRSAQARRGVGCRDGAEKATRTPILVPFQTEDAPRLLLVTGATSRLGTTFARRVAEENAFDRMLLCGRNHRKGEALAAELAASGIHADFLAVDLSCQMEVRSLCSQLQGRPIHCAALLAGVTAVPTREETPDGLELHFGLNYLSRFHLVTALLENLQAAGTEMSPARVLLCGSSRHRGELAGDEIYSGVLW
eukprot:s2328_g5.t1